jgi:hypothetical protein
LTPRFNPSPLPELPGEFLAVVEQNKLDNQSADALAVRINKLLEETQRELALL